MRDTTSDDTCQEDDEWPTSGTATDRTVTPSSGASATSPAGDSYQSSAKLDRGVASATPPCSDTVDPRTNRMVRERLREAKVNVMRSTWKSHDGTRGVVSPAGR